MTMPKNDIKLEQLKTKFRLSNGEVYEKLIYLEQVAWFKPRVFMRGKYLCLYFSKNVHIVYHRVVWMLHHDTQIPRDETGQLFIVDHFDSNKLNNAPWDLRLVTHTENMNNKTKIVLFD